MIRDVLHKLIEMKSTTAVAVVGLVTPMWQPWLETVSTFFALITPILAAIWLGTQIYQSWAKWYFKEK